jgi:uroporphyrinogen-III synthase
MGKSKPEIVIVGTAATGGRLRAMLAQAPVSVTVDPVIAVAPIDDLAAVDAGLARLGREDWVVALSRPAVDILAARRAAVAGRVACVGRATADAARAAGLRVELVGPGTAGELIAALAETSGVGSAQVLILRSAAGTEPVGTPLVGQAREVVEIVAYANRSAGPDLALWRRLAAGPHGSTDVVVLSPSAAEAWWPGLTDDLRSRLRAAVGRVVAIGPTTAAAVAALDTGLPVVAASPPGLPGVAAAILTDRCDP